ncbi:MAG: hypothetical protein B7733_22125 [Myxococcales bacterium FL481]|nr:MAG: hypothetical protein B7733_22125 [Myxococcales bacterium FL481]
MPSRSRLRVNGLSMVRQSALADIGIAQLPAFAVADDLERGDLVSLLDSHATEVGESTWCTLARGCWRPW